MGMSFFAHLGCGETRLPSPNKPHKEEIEPTPSQPEPDPNPVPPGELQPLKPCELPSGYLALSEVAKFESITAEPDSCKLFGIDTGGQKAFILNTTVEAELPIQSIALGGTPTDLTLDISGDFFYVSLGDNQKILKLSRTNGALAGTISTQTKPQHIAAGPNDRVFYVEKEQFSSIYAVNFTNDEDLQLTDPLYFEPDIATNSDATKLFLGESIEHGSRLLRFNTGDPTLPLEDQYDFSEGGFTEPWPKRGIQLSPANDRVFFAERSYDASDLGYIRGWIGGHVLGVSSDGGIIVTRDSFYDGKTFVRFGTRPHPGEGLCFSRDGQWFFEFDTETRILHQTAIESMVGAHRLGATLLPGGTLSRHRFLQMLTDPYRPIIYGLDAQQNQLVFINRETLVPEKAIVVGSLPTHMVIDASGDYMLVATFGATEIARVDLTSQAAQTKDVFVVPSNPYRLTVDKVNNRIVYAEQDGSSALTLMNGNTGAVLKRINGLAFQPALAFDDSGRYLFVGESTGPDTVLKRFDTLTDTFDPAGQAAGTFSYPARKIHFKNNSVFYAGRRFHGTTLVLMGLFGEEINTVTNNGSFAASNRHIFNTGDYSEVDGLPEDSSVITSHPSDDILYQFDNDTGSLYVKTIGAGN